MAPSRREVVAGVGALAVAGVAGCAETTTEDVNETLRYGYDVTFGDDGDQMAVNVDGSIGEIVWPGDLVIIEVRVYIDGDLRARKTIEVRETEKRTDWGVAFLLPRTDGDLSVEAEAIEYITEGED